jgi:hypothetical protein
MAAEAGDSLFATLDPLACAGIDRGGGTPTRRPDFGISYSSQSDLEQQADSEGSKVLETIFPEPFF